MADFVEDFLQEAASRLSELESFQQAWKQNFIQEEYLDSLDSFFDFIRSVSPFAGFMRSYRLSDAALREIRAYQEKKQTQDILSSVWKKLQRVKSILILAENSKEEAYEKDDDLLLPVYDGYEQEQFLLNQELTETKLALKNYQKKLALQEDLQKQSESLLKTKVISLNDKDREIQNLTRLLEEKNVLDRQREEQFCQELQKNHKETETLRENLKKLAEIKLKIEKDRERFFLQQASLEKELNRMSEILAEEKENKEQILEEKRELEKQHLDFNARLIALQEKLTAEAEKVKHMEKQLERQKYSQEIVESELRVTGWPHDVEKIQKELAILARQNENKNAIDSLTTLKELISQIRMRSFVEMSRFFQETVEMTSRKYQRSYEFSVNCDVSGGIDKEALATLKQMFSQLTDNAFRYAVPQDQKTLQLNFTAQENSAYLRCSFWDNGASFDFNRLYNTAKAAGLIEKNAPLSQPDLLTFLFHNAVKFQGKKRGLINAAALLEKSGGQVSVDFKDGLRVDFSIPKRFLFDKVLLFRLAGQLLAVPLNAVAETVFFDDEGTEKEIKNTFFYWKGLSLPILRLDNTNQNNFGIIIQSGIFSFFLPVQQILDTEYFLSFSDKEGKSAFSYFLPCTVLESGREPLWLDIAELLKQVVLPLSKKVVAVPEDNLSKSSGKERVSYLIFKSEPSSFGAVRVEDVLKVEDFSVSPNNAVRKKYLDAQEKRLPVKDSCPRDGYPYAQAVLVFKRFVLAIHEVVDIIDVPPAVEEEDHTDFIVYHGRKVKVFSTDL